ncbi:3-keto-disaccharide hydrolase [Haloferula sp.]|uniref:3-keto-disaccharide hydrolase n=1 Tax=Haloferula sp. TaxID=2497595 RepID=UPI00329E1909
MMNPISIALVAAAVFPVTLFGGEKESLFNGKDLAGWEGDPRLWSVVDGVLVGETDKAERSVKKNTFLIWQGGDVEDFDFEMTARAKGNNSGVQYRSKVIDAATWSVGGYQMDMHPKQPFLGMLYEERGRGISCQRGQKVVLEKGAKPKVTGELPVPEVKLEEWNTYRIEARGKVVKHFVNGELAAEITDNDPEKRSLKGSLAIQLHAGPAMKVEVKEISLKKVAK